MRPPAIYALLPPLILLLLPTLLLWRVVFSGDVFLPADMLKDIAPWHASDPTHIVPWNPLMWDGMAEFYPWRLFAAESLHHGWLPLWNPHQFCGTPFVANAQSAVFYPPNLIFCVMPVARAFGVSVWLHLALTGLFLYGFLRSQALALSPPAALLGAIAWQMSAWQIAWLALPTFLCVSCWLPFALWLTWRACAPPPASGEVGRWAALGVCLGVMVLAGHLQIALYCLGLTAAYAVFLLWPRRRLPGGILVALGLMLGLTAPQVLPTAELARVSHRSGTSATWHSYHAYTSLAVPPLSLVTLFLPGFFGNPTEGTYWGTETNGGSSAYAENACYVGVLTLGLAFLGAAVTWRKSRQTQFFTVAACVALLMALGTPLDALPYFGLPGFAQSASPGRVLVIWSLCAALLAALGAEAVLQRTERRGKTKFAVGAVFGLSFLLALSSTVYWIQRHGLPHALAVNLPRVGDLWRVPLGVLLGAAALHWLRRHGTLSGHAQGILLAVLVALDLLAANWVYNRTATVAQVYPETPGIAFLRQHGGTERILTVNHGWSIELNRPPDAVLPPNAATVYGLNEVGGYDSLLTRRAFRFVAALDGGRNPAPQENGNMVFTRNYSTPEVQAAAARYVVTRAPLADSHLRLEVEGGGMFVYDNAAALPRARTGRQSALLQDLAPTRIGADVTTPNNGVLVVADQWYPGWQARVGRRGWAEARPVEITLEQGMFRRVMLRPTDAEANKDARVEMRYLPASFRVGLYGFLLAFAALSGLIAAGMTVRGSSRRRRG